MVEGLVSEPGFLDSNVVEYWDFEFQDFGRQTLMVT